MTLDPAKLAAAAAGPPLPCACACSTYGHPRCDRPADTLDNAPSVFHDPSSGTKPVCRQCARERAALTSPDGATATITFPARKDERFTADALKHLLGKPINVLVFPGWEISGTVRDAVVINDGRAAELTIDAARLIEFLFPAPEGTDVARLSDPDRRRDDQAVRGDSTAP